MPGLTLANPYLTNELSPPRPRSYRYDQWVERGYQARLRSIASDNELGSFDWADGLGRQPRTCTWLSVGFGGVIWAPYYRRRWTNPVCSHAINRPVTPCRQQLM